ncbi:glucose-6-phosphate 1-dehydrogenase [Alkalihalobacillus alcalophilus ATCC 27647 = CGMCC 1.3604]|uniref:Glucose-6-phosphate 1-dehydrogenase n=1 Tax=Alkalihalobacillus alcalophilus ATCC 27647 = CGMCC 1.3604 TaxID=1218173 RepID=A0A4S4JVX4_ALKAL|nr:glucose-6-phosphate dehydrogenase [Alkalihalobacillus alcalophilus]MED1560619.1 glucose-6-phosphate dehydrogenase [Alkalihalobacillus alcalophilus]THG88387.1 glucose-6-phosphate 1-dehydrogenase [Alkalihalobacillus alcalophilus ATCC 27647 = CGMCC 1.3604]
MDSMTFVLFGATGDLAKRKIYPALFNLYLNQKLPKSFSVIGVGRGESSDDEFQSRVIDSLHIFSRHLLNDKSKKEEFVKPFRYYHLDVTDTKGYKKLLKLVQQNEKKQNMEENRMFYLSMAPEFFDVIAMNIKDSGLGSTNGWKRLIIEKPFGHDLKSAQELNEKLSKAFEEDEIYRIDHYLGKPMVQNLEALTFANPVLQSLWNNRYIANVQITASEIVGVEERAGYYDQTGAIRDMVQNHMLQLLMMTAMHLPKRISTNDIRNEKRKVMESLRPLQRDTIGVHVVRGQYEHGEINGEPVIAYREEPGVEASSQNDTFVAARLWIDNSFWDGVPFYIRTGKRMAEKATKIVIEFKNTLKDFDNSEMDQIEPNLLTININPNEGVSLQLNSKNPINGKTEPITVDFSASNQDVPEAYELLLFDALVGDSTFFAHWNEVELSWNWVEPILEAFKENKAVLHFYSSGSMGPEAAHQLLEEDGYKWW